MESISFILLLLNIFCSNYSHAGHKHGKNIIIIGGKVQIVINLLVYYYNQLINNYNLVSRVYLKV